MIHHDESALQCAAEEIGASLVKSCVRRGSEVQWLVDPSTASEWKALEECGEYLYRGVSGIALFFAELYRATNDQSCRQLAIDATETAIARVERFTGSGPAGLYCGPMGVCLAAQRISEILDYSIRPERLTRIIAQVASRERENRICDVISGTAGTLIAMAYLHRRIGGDWLLEQIEVYARKLIQKRIEFPWGNAWDDSLLHIRPLVGLSHGASGVGVALLEGFERLGDSQMLAHGLKAFAYENEWFDRSSENWPDFRSTEAFAATQDGAGLSSLADSESFGNGRLDLPRSMFAWCHGAPGIALARMRAIEITNASFLHGDLELAMVGTRRSVTLSDAGGHSLCHGLLGNCEALDIFYKHSGAHASRNDLIAYLAGTCRAISLGRKTWISGAFKGAPDPSLMVGNAGVGLALLRISNSLEFTPLLPTLGDQLKYPGPYKPSDSNLANFHERPTVLLLPEKQDAPRLMALKQQRFDECNTIDSASFYEVLKHSHWINKTALLHSARRVLKRSKLRAAIERAATESQSVEDVLDGKLVVSSSVEVVFSSQKPSFVRTSGRQNGSVLLLRIGNRVHFKYVGELPTLILSQAYSNGEFFLKRFIVRMREQRGAAHETVHLLVAAQVRALVRVGVLVSGGLGSAGAVGR